MAMGDSMFWSHWRRKDSTGQARGSASHSCPAGLSSPGSHSKLGFVGLCAACVWAHTWHLCARVCTLKESVCRLGQAVEHGWSGGGVP